MAPSFTYVSHCIETRMKEIEPVGMKKMNFNYELNHYQYFFKEIFVLLRFWDRVESYGVFNRIIIVRFENFEGDFDGRNQIFSYGEQGFDQRGESILTSKFGLFGLSRIPCKDQKEELFEWFTPY